MEPTATTSGRPKIRLVMLGDEWDHDLNDWRKAVDAHSDWLDRVQDPDDDAVLDVEGLSERLGREPADITVIGSHGGVVDGFWIHEHKKQRVRPKDIAPGRLFAKGLVIVDACGSFYAMDEFLDRVPVGGMAVTAGGKTSAGKGRLLPGHGTELLRNLLEKVKANPAVLTDVSGGATPKRALTQLVNVAIYNATVDRQEAIKRHNRKQEEVRPFMGQWIIETHW